MSLLVLLLLLYPHYASTFYSLKTADLKKVKSRVVMNIYRDNKNKVVIYLINPLYVKCKVIAIILIKYYSIDLKRLINKYALIINH